MSIALGSRSLAKAVLKIGGTLGIFVWCLFPFVWLIDTSLKINDLALNSPNLFEGPIGLNNYLSVVQQGFIYNLRNSFVVAGTTTALCIGIGSLGAYAVARLRLRRKAFLLSGVLALSLFPPVALVPPLYEVWRSADLLNTYQGMIVPYVAFTLPITIFILTNFFAALPVELEEQALVDGASHLKAFYRRVHPGGFLWKFVADQVPDVQGTTGYGYLFLDWLAGIVLVYMSLFGVGHVIFGDYANGLLFLALAALSAWYIYRDLNRRGWTELAR